MDAVIARLKALDEQRKQIRREKRERKRKRRRKENQKEKGDDDSLSFKLPSTNTAATTSEPERKISPQANGPQEQNSLNDSEDTIIHLEGGEKQRRTNHEQTTEKQENNGPSTAAAAAMISPSSILSSSPPSATIACIRERLPLGYFHGRTIFRNSLHPSEQLKDGFVRLEELVPPNCQRILATSFCAPKAFEWLDQTILGGPYGKYPRPTHVLLVHHGPFAIGEPELEQIRVRRKKQEHWYKLACQPHTGGCMHPKVILFRTAHGLRVVVSGNNFYQYQWENDRDCLWAQDFPISATTTTTTTSHHHHHEEEYNHNMPLRSFLTDLCRGSTHHRFVMDHLEALFCKIDLSQSKASLVYSFPRRTRNNNTNNNTHNNGGEKGGWKQLTNVVQDCLLDGYDTENDYNSPNTCDYPSPSDKPRYVLYTMSGSIGDVDPTLLRCMKNAMTGQDTFFDDFADDNKKALAKEWAKIVDIQCLLPSLKTARSMDPVWNGRLMSKSHWNSIPRRAQQNLFADAIPNPNFERTPQRPKHPFAHAKVLYCKYTTTTTTTNHPKLAPAASSSPSLLRHHPRNTTTTTTTNNKPSILYVGSHNLSKAAWGIADRMPLNVEVGVVLSTSDPNLQQEWESRLPYLLSPPGNISGSSRYFKPLVEGDWKAISQTPHQMLDITKQNEDSQSSTEELLGTQEPMSPKFKL